MNNRNFELDGIRGWAAFMVLMVHLIEILYINNSVSNGVKTILSGVFDGTLMVCIFFVLSGDALTSYVKNAKLPLLKMYLFRYLRLLSPILLSCLLVYILYILGLNFSLNVRQYFPESWICKFLDFKLGFIDMLKYSFYDVIYKYQDYTISYQSEKFSYNPLLWTMSIELIGSFIIFTILKLFKGSVRYVLLIIGLLIGLYLKSYLTLFFIGSLINTLRYKITDIIGKDIFQYIQIIILIGVLVCKVVFKAEIMDKHHFLAYMVLPTIVLVSVIMNKKLTDFFSNRLSMFLGKISLTLYIYQFAVIISVTNGLLFLFHNNINIITLVVTFVISIISTIYVSLYMAKVDLYILTKIKKAIR